MGQSSLCEMNSVVSIILAGRSGKNEVSGSPVVSEVALVAGGRSGQVELLYWPCTPRQNLLL